MTPKVYKPEIMSQPGEGVRFLHAKPNASERRRIDLIVRVDSAVTKQDKTALRKLKRECAEIPYLAKQIETALRG